MQYKIIQNIECCSDDLCCLSTILDLKSGNGKQWPLFEMPCFCSENVHKKKEFQDSTHIYDMCRTHSLLLRKLEVTTIGVL